MRKVIFHISRSLVDAVAMLLRKHSIFQFTRAANEVHPSSMQANRGEHVAKPMRFVQPKKNESRTQKVGLI